MEFTDITADTAQAFFTCLSCQSVETCDALTPHQMAWKQWHSDHKDMGLKAKVLKVNGAVVGRCHYGPIKISPLVGRDMTVILCLYVHMHEHPLGDQRGLGYGRAMLEAVESDAQTSGAQAVAAWATDGSWYPVSFYLHAGYTEVDREDGVIAVWKPFSTKAEAPRILRLPDHPSLHADKVAVLVADNNWCSGSSRKRLAREAVAGLEAMTDYIEVGPPFDGRIIHFGTVGGIFLDGEAYRPDEDITESSDLRRCIVEMYQRKCAGEQRME